MELIQNNNWQKNKGKILLLIAMLLGLIIHGPIFYFTLNKTYDAFVHIFFADHYARSWFEPWEYRWYTGFSTTSYPPLNHQAVALISKIFPIKVAFTIYTIFIFQVVIIGVYRFSKLFFTKTTAGVSAIVVILLSSILETLHVYGQLPTLAGIGFLLNALPFLYYFIRRKGYFNFFMAMSFLSIVVCSHHVTAIFGLVFFIAPTVLMALIDDMPQKDKQQSLRYFIKSLVKKCLQKSGKILLFGFSLITLVIGLIYPYWYWSKTDPITQVSIPHGSRDDFIANPSSGLIFYIIPLLLIIAFLPVISYLIIRQKRFLGWAISFFFCLVLGAGSTTPIAKLLLGEYAFNILTLDRFAFWASIIAIPFLAKFFHSFITGSVKAFWVNNYGKKTHFILSGITGFSYFMFIIFIFHLGSFRPLQPKEVEIDPILNFLNRDNHNEWRYLALGFGDQMAWLSTNTIASTVDGNYHSARRLPELTSRPIERLENAKFNGDQGLASLRHFLSSSEEYSLKYVFNNDRYYDPLLYYNGWTRTIRLENGIMVWEKGNITPISKIKSKKLHPYLKNAWGIVPISSLIVAFLLTVMYMRTRKELIDNEDLDKTSDYYPKTIVYAASLIPVLLFTGFMFKQLHKILWVNEQKDPVTAVLSCYNHLDFQRFEKAYTFFKPSVTYSLDQFLLEKSVIEGGLVPSYAKLDSISVNELSQSDKRASVEVFTRWNTALGPYSETDTLDLIKENRMWYILPKKFDIEIPDLQIRSQTYTLYKKQGKRVISSFPTVKDDRVKKPFAAFKQANLIEYEGQYCITGELLNADDIPINVSLKAIIILNDGSTKVYYPTTSFIYNLSPKESGCFQIEITDKQKLESIGIKNIELVCNTDVSERGYIHGTTFSYKVDEMANTNMVLIEAELFNEHISTINIPGLLTTEKDSLGRIWQTKLLLHPKAVQSGLNIELNRTFLKIQNSAKHNTTIPISLKINGQIRTELGITPDAIANSNKGISVQTHCFIGEPIYLQ